MTSNTSELASTMSITASDIPAPVSIIITSAIESSSYIIFTIPEIWSLDKFDNSLIPEPPDINPIFSGPRQIISFMPFLPYIISAILYLGLVPSITSTLASPKSASSITTFFPSLPSCIAILTDIFDLPTPPFPLVTVITLARCCCIFCCFIIFLSCCA